ncbi:MAG: permease-like cell division protein FtsX [Candidatus Electryonea clarkiae]|nr:permease-like cell division protein FtsX [Candidatus Electryonea clarkiae]MDP8285932.1 permease-like cell division protein FtsX [Candidatus Electryonea clarkiae]
MRKWLFGLREGLGIFTRSGVAGLMTMLSFSILAGLFCAVWASNQALENARLQLLSMFELEVYLLPGRDDNAEDIHEQIANRKGVISTVIISRDQAARQFADQFGEELFNLLGENPLPVSIKIGYDPQQVSRKKLSLEAQDIAKFDGVDEVVYEGDLLAKLEGLITKVRDRLMIIALAVMIVALVLTIQAVRVASKAVQPWVRAVTLVGGSYFQITLPFTITGALAGFFGGMAGAVILEIIQAILAKDTDFIPPPQISVALIVIVLTIVLGAVTATFAAPRGLEHKPVA